MRLKTRAEKQAERAAKTAPKYDRAFSRRQWAQSFASGTFRFRRKLPSCPSFQGFCEKFSPTIRGV